MQEAVDVDDLNQLGRAELVEQVRDIDNAPAWAGGAPGPQRASPDHALEPQLFPLERCSRPAQASRILQVVGHHAQRGQAGVEFLIGRGPHRRDR